MEPIRWRQYASETAASKVPHSYLLEHLATFSGVSKQGSLLSPEDGMRQLHQMALKQGHWVLRARLLVKSQHLVILDANSGDEMEIISLDTVRLLTAFMNPASKDVFNNILLFTTVDASDPQGNEMHIFQCLDEMAQTIVDDINNAKANLQQRDYIPYQKQQQPDDWQQRTVEFEAAAKRTANAVGTFNPTPQASQFRQNLQRGGADANQHIMEGVELLNHCFDDIEQFMNQLQKVADAYKELEFRRRGRNRIGDGMLTLRARNPSQQAFTDVFQKFKLSFNLLAKLKPYIHDPNAPELVHYLFAPLGLVVEASHDPRLGPGGLSSKVISPLLTHEALDLLSNCLTSKEMELHRRLGDAWIISRSEWRGYVPPYIPRFYDGWTPPVDWLDDDAKQAILSEQRHIEATTQGSHIRPESNFSTYQRSADYGFPPADIYGVPHKLNKSETSSPAASVINGGDDQAEKAFLRELLSRNALIYQVIQGRKSDKKQELTIEKGEFVEVLDNNRQWWRVRNSKGQAGYAPNTLLQPYSANSYSTNPKIPSSYLGK